MRIKIRKIMCRPEILAGTISPVSQETGIPAERILSPDKDAETADARHLLVSLLADRGMYPSRIAVHIRKAKRAANCMIPDFRERMEGGKMLGIYWENIRKPLGNN